MGRLGDGWVTLAPTLERFAAARARSIDMPDEHGRAGNVRLALSIATFNIQADGDRAKGEGWKWMERFFEQPVRSSATISLFLARATECVRLLKGYAAAGLTAIIARIASDDVGEQSRILLNETQTAIG